MSTLFWLGTHKPAWLKRVAIPLFISRRTLSPLKSFPRALGTWALDSGGFTALSTRGAWDVTAREYVAEVRRWSEEIGPPAWVAIMDWMCEPWILQRTGLSVREHQANTVRSFLELRELAPDVPWIPILQGWQHRDYFRHVEEYEAAGVALSAAPLVGLGSVCRRQHTGQIHFLVRQLALDFGLRLHGFGVKTLGLEKVAGVLASADSMAWSAAARREPPLPGHPHQSCANCLSYALRWRERLLARTRAVPSQGALF